MIVVGGGSSVRSSSGRRSDLARACLPVGLACLVGIVLGGAVAEEGFVADLAIAVAGGFCLLFVIAQIRFAAVLIWVAIGGLAYPFLRYPTSHSVVTFDRIWVLSMVGWLVTSRASIAASSPTRRMLFAGAWLVAAFGIRAALTSGAARQSLETWLDALVLPSILLMATYRGVKTSIDVDRLGRAFAVAGTILGALAVAQRLFGVNLASRLGASPIIAPGVGSRVAGPYQTDDVLAVALLLCFAATLYWIQRRAGRRYIAVLVIGVELAGIFLTFFRGAYIAALIVAVMGLGLRPMRHGRLVAVAATAATLALVGYLQAGDTVGLSQRLNNTQNVNGRLATYEQGYSIFRQHPLVGVGVGEFAAAQAQEAGVAVNGVSAVTTAHSSYVSTLAEEGLWGFAPLIALTITVGLLVRAFVKVAREPGDTLFAAACVGGVLAYFVMSIELTTVLISTDNLFLAVLLGACAARVDTAMSRASLRPRQPAARVGAEKTLVGMQSQWDLRMTSPGERGVE